MPDLQGLYARAERQHGLLGLHDGEPSLSSADAIGKLAARHGWSRPQPGVVALPGAAATFETRVMAAVLSVRGQVLAGRLTAAHLWGMVGHAPTTIDLVVPHVRRRHDLRGVHVWRSRTLTPGDMSSVRGIPATAPARTVVDLAAVLGVPALRAVVIDARQRRVITLPEIRAAWRRLARAPGRHRLTRVLTELDEETSDSELERRFRALLRDRGLRPYPRPLLVRCPDGVTVHVDVAFPRERVACECDGLGAHSRRADLVADHRRQNALVAAGWRPFWVDWTRLAREPDVVVAELRGLLSG